MSRLIFRVLCILVFSIPTLATANEACEELNAELLTDVFGGEASAASFRPGSKYVPNSLCTATWEKANQDSQTRFTVSLTVIDQEFGSPAAAAASLESSVEELSKGISIKVQGKTHTKQVKFDDWLEGVGNKAIWAPKLSELQVADDNGRFAVSVRGFDDASQNLSKAVELARRLARND